MGEKYKIKSWHVILVVVVLIYFIDKCSMEDESNKIIEYKQRDRIERYYNDENGNPKMRETIYYDGRPTEYKYYKH